MPTSSPEEFASPLGPFRLGTCSWADRELIESGAFYPPGSNTPAGRLSYYASQFPVVEVDTTYYHLPSPQMVQGWAENTPESFLFDEESNLRRALRLPVSSGRVAAVTRAAFRTGRARGGGPFATNTNRGDQGIRNARLLDALLRESRSPG